MRIASARHVRLRAVGRAQSESCSRLAIGSASSRSITREQGATLFFASEAKALLPFLPDIETDSSALAEYLTFQYTIGARTLFKGIDTLLPGHSLVVSNGEVAIRRYWDVQYEVDFDHSPRYFEARFKELLTNSMNVHLRADVPIGGYVSGGIDSSLVALLASRQTTAIGTRSMAASWNIRAMTRAATPGRWRSWRTCRCTSIDITADDFRDHIARRDLPSRFSGRRARIVSAIHGVGAGGEAV